MMMAVTDSGQQAGYHHVDARPNPPLACLWPVLDAVVANGAAMPSRAFDVDCGNGSTSAQLSQNGFGVIGVDVAEQGIAIARRTFPGGEAHVHSVCADLAGRYGTFPLLVCLEVIEHLDDPRRLIRTIRDLLEPGGTLVLSTPYHGYWKNRGLAVLGRWDDHHQPLNHSGHVAFFATATLLGQLHEEQLEAEALHRVGRRLPAFARSMGAVARRPA